MDTGRLPLHHSLHRTSLVLLSTAAQANGPRRCMTACRALPPCNAEVAACTKGVLWEKQLLCTMCAPKAVCTYVSAAHAWMGEPHKWKKGT